MVGRVAKAKKVVGIEVSSKGGYLHLEDLAYASSSFREWRWRGTTNRDKAAYAAAFRVEPVHSTWPAPPGPAHATKQNRVSMQHDV